MTNVPKAFRFLAMSRFLAAGCVLLGLGLFAGCGDKPKAPGSCKSEKDCKDGQKCFENKCVLCIEDSHCGQGQRCSAGACVAKPECEKDDECSPGKVCQAGKCKACAMDSECGPGGSCEAGACKKAQSCTKDDDCADDEDCVSGFCRRAGATSTNVGGCQPDGIRRHGAQQQARDQEQGDGSHQRAPLVLAPVPCDPPVKHPVAGYEPAGDIARLAGGGWFGCPRRFRLGDHFDSRRRRRDRDGN